MLANALLTVHPIANPTLCPAELDHVALQGSDIAIVLDKRGMDIVFEPWVRISKIGGSHHGGSYLC